MFDKLKNQSFKSRLFRGFCTIIVMMIESLASEINWRPTLSTSPPKKLPRVTTTYHPAPKNKPPLELYQNKTSVSTKLLLHKAITEEWEEF
ncbi:MAG: hypothetical protein ACXW04_09370 [Methylobacter sp.]